MAVIRPCRNRWVSPGPYLEHCEERLLNEVLTSGQWWRGGYADDGDSKVGQFEAAFARFQDAEHAVAVTNGTAALECALKAVGIGAGDEVLVPAATFVASATAVLLVGARPVIVDVDPRNYTIAPAAAAAAITPRTRAIMAVDYGGMPCDMAALDALGRRHDLAIVSDCAHSHGSQWQGVGTGALGDVGAFSFQMGKTLTTGEGGMVLTNSQELADRAYSYHHIGRIRGRRFNEFHVPATNLRMTEWQGAMGLAQLTRLAAQTAARERNATYLADRLAEIPGVAPLWRDPPGDALGLLFLALQVPARALEWRHLRAVPTGTRCRRRLLRHRPYPAAVPAPALCRGEYRAATDGPEFGQGCRLQAQWIARRPSVSMRPRRARCSTASFSVRAATWTAFSPLLASSGRTKTSCGGWQSERAPGASRGLVRSAGGRYRKTAKGST